MTYTLLEKTNNTKQEFKTLEDVSKRLNISRRSVSALLRKKDGNKKYKLVKNGTPVHGNKLEIFHNEDKKWHEKWKDGDAMLDVPHPFRCVLCGPPNCGKTGMILNLLIKNRPYFEEVIIIHCDPEYTKEYDDVTCIMTDKIPSPNEWAGDKKTLVILDDLEYKTLPKDQIRNLDRLFGFVSTHKNISVCLSAQDVFNIPAGVRRCTNFWVLWKIDDLDAISRLARRVNCSAKKIQHLFEKHIKDKHDCIVIDNTPKSPYPLRKNGVYPIIFNGEISELSNN